MRGLALHLFGASQYTDPPVLGALSLLISASGTIPQRLSLILDPAQSESALCLIGPLYLRMRKVNLILGICHILDPADMTCGIQVVPGPRRAALNLRCR